MDIENAVVEVGLENGASSGGGDGNAVAIAISMPPCPVDPQMKETQPSTWLGISSYIAAMVGGTVMMIAGGALETYVRIGLFLSGVLLLFLATFTSDWLCPTEGWCQGDELPRFGPD